MNAQREAAALRKAIKGLTWARQIVERQLPGLYDSAPAYVGEVEAVIRVLNEAVLVMEGEDLPIGDEGEANR